MRIMGLDYGDKTVGVAISDELLLTAQPVETIQRERPAKLRKTFARIEELIGTYEVDRIVLGLPKRMDNQEGERCERTREFGDQLAKRTGIEIIYQERVRCLRTTYPRRQAILEKIPGRSRKGRTFTGRDRYCPLSLLPALSDAVPERP